MVGFASLHPPYIAIANKIKLNSPSFLINTQRKALSYNLKNNIYLLQGLAISRDFSAGRGLQPRQAMAFICGSYPPSHLLIDIFQGKFMLNRLKDDRFVNPFGNRIQPSLFILSVIDLDYGGML